MVVSFCDQFGVTLGCGHSVISGNLLNPHLPSGPVHPYQLDESTSNLGVPSVLFHSIVFRIDIPVSKQ